MAIEENFDVGFIAKLTAEEKQIQQNYRPVIGVHKWFARRPGSMFRGLLLSEYGNGAPLREGYFRSHQMDGITIADPFMGGGTTLFEANRLGCNVVGFDINPMAYWVVRQELVGIDRRLFRSEAESVVSDVKGEVKELYETNCVECGSQAQVKYFLWVKRQQCASCGHDLDLFPGYLIAGKERHTHFVLHCPCCTRLVQVKELPDKGLVKCPECDGVFAWKTGPASRNRYTCSCGHVGKYPAELREQGAPRHRLVGMEYNCQHCLATRKGRWFKTADQEDLDRFEQACSRQGKLCLPCPGDSIPDGDETKRLHRWGYHRYSEMFNERQLLTLGLLARRIRQIADQEARHALATVFSDSLRYQNMLCRYDIYALKCQDIFAVHGFPVGLIQCENNVLGIPKVGAGGFRHFVEKYDRAKAYCERPFETFKNRTGRKLVIPVAGERIIARVVSSSGHLRGTRRAFLAAASLEENSLCRGTLDGVFTDPPYFDNVQYAELMDFCYAWLRILLRDDIPEFERESTRSEQEFTGNRTLGRDLVHFTAGLAGVFTTAAAALKDGAPFVFTYHHNDFEAYVPIIVAILDAGLVCTATLPCPAEMTASLHINGTGSSVMDSIIVCRRQRTKRSKSSRVGRAGLRRLLVRDREMLLDGEIECSRGDLMCLAMGHLARVATSTLRKSWDNSATTEAKMVTATKQLTGLLRKCEVETVVQEALAVEIRPKGMLPFSEIAQSSVAD